MPVPCYHYNRTFSYCNIFTVQTITISIPVFTEMMWLETENLEYTQIYLINIQEHLVNT